MRIAVLALALCVLPFAAGCPRPHRRTLVPSIPQGGDVRARQRFEEARARFERDRTGGAEMAAIARDYPDDPIAPYARLYAGIGGIAKGDYAAAADTLGRVLADPAATRDDGLGTRASLFLGIADAYLGKGVDAAPLLARGEKAIENDGERGEWTASTAAAIAIGPRPLDALPWFDRYWAVAHPAERGYILARLDELVAAAPADAIVAAWQGLEHKDGPAAAALGGRATESLTGDAARDAHDQANRARASLGLPPLAPLVIAATPGEADGSRPGLIGAALPITGKQERLGDLALHGLAIAAGALGGPAAATAEIRDTGATGAAAAIDALADSGAIAIVGPIDGASVDDAAGRAAARGVPMLSLNARADERARAAPFVFHVMHSAEARARMLASRAAGAGVKKVAILAPDSGYGRAVAKAFTDVYTAAGGVIVTRVDYKADTKSFADEVTKLKSGWDAVFIPEQADRLGLIAPALDAAGMMPRPWNVKKKVKGGRPILVLTTAENAGPDLLHTAGRHLYGAWLACGFYADATDPLISDYVARYLSAFVKAPTALDAYAYDAALVIAKLGAGTRADLAGKLGTSKIMGVTGEIRFDADHRRADDGVLFVVEDDGAGGARVKAVR